MKFRHLILLCFVAIISPVVAARAQEEKPTRTVWSGIYSAEQAARGEAKYQQRCSRCHGASLEGTQGNGLTGKDFMERWREDSMGSLFEFVSESMPLARRGEGRPLISIPDYLEIVAFILSKNQFPPGAKDLTVDGLDDIRIQYKDGPRAVPTGALVRIYGCLTGSGQDWKISSAHDAVRTRTSDTNNYQEFKEAEDAAAGNQTFGLFNLGFLGNQFKPEAHAGEKLLVKGNLIRQTDSSRITVLSVRKVADSCP
jgi:quinoprotein glucose dehydrogenase